ARFMFNDTTLKILKKIKVPQFSGDTNGQPLWRAGMAAGEPDTIDGDPYTVNQQMPSGTGTKAIIYGDLSQYIIRDVRDITLVRLDERYAELGVVAFLAFSRHAGDLLNAGTNPVKYLTMGAEAPTARGAGGLTAAAPVGCRLAPARIYSASRTIAAPSVRVSGLTCRACRVAGMPGCAPGSSRFRSRLKWRRTTPRSRWRVSDAHEAVGARAVPRRWPNSTVVCLASGPSLTPEDVAFCRGKAPVI